MTAEAMSLKWAVLEQLEEERIPAESIPSGCEFIWETFLALGSGRTCGFGHNPIGWPDILAWSTLHDVRLTHFEMNAIKKLDERFLQIMGRKKKHARSSTT